MDYEDLILTRQEWSECDLYDECSFCDFRGDACDNQCMEVQLIYNPFLRNF